MRKLVTRLVAQVDQMWPAVDELEGLRAIAADGTSRNRELVTHFLDFVQQDLVGLFIDLAREVSRMLSLDTPCKIEAFDAAGDRFARNVDIAWLAASDPVIPASVRVVVQRSNRLLSESWSDFAALVGALMALSVSHEHRSRHS